MTGVLPRIASGGYAVLKPLVSGSTLASVVSYATVNGGVEPGQGSGEGAVFLGASR